MTALTYASLRTNILFRANYTCAFSNLNQVTENIRQFFVFLVEILCATSDGDKKLWPFHVPVFLH